jgi:tetratricopeptide (TPR) repeat protein
MPELGEPCELAWPLDGEALEDLRWYLEDYLRAPFGVYEDRGPLVQARLAGWGAAVFEAVFGSRSARDAYQRARAGQAELELIFRSASPGLLGLPWELMADPDRPTPLALNLAGLSRSLPAADLGETFAVPGGRLRVLMVICRPAGTSDVRYRMIARPLLERLDAVRGNVDLMVLRPPTLDALRETLLAAAQAGEPFHIVHFDGHGVLAGQRVGDVGLRGRPVTFPDPGIEGMLAFEKPGGGSDLVAAAKLAQVLSGGRVPVVVLNACQSGAIGRELEATVATRLLQEGTESVVAMAYTVYAVAAAEFMAAFYERLFAGDSVSTAVTWGRRRMFQADGRPSPKGEMPLADWLVPVHYLRRDVAFPHARTSREPGLSLDAALNQARGSGTPVQAGHQAGDLYPGGLGRGTAFVGRDDLFYQLESAARLEHVLVLQGPGGTGKTELARAFGQWWRDTGGVDQPGWVLWHSFEPGLASVGLDSVINQAGLRLYGTQFALLEPDQRCQTVEQAMAEHRMLLIWDNFETVASMPDPTGITPPLDDADRVAMRDFLARVARGRSAVIITSRSPEDWLGTIRRIQVGGLTPQEASEYADIVLAPYPATVGKRANRAFGELMEFLAGHPLGIRLTLPHLDATSPQALLAGVRGTAPLPGQDFGGEGDPEGSRDASLGACIRYSYAHLGERSRQLLSAVCLFEGIADINVLTAFSQIPGVPERFGQAGPNDWREALEDAARTGLLTGLGGGRYQIHPALPAYLAGLWRQDHPDGYDAVREAATRALATAYAGLFARLAPEITAGAGRALIALHQRTLGSVLGYCLGRKLWQEVGIIGGVLELLWSNLGLDEEANGWEDRIRLATEDANGRPPSLDSTAGDLWVYFTGVQAERQINRQRLDDAERTFREILGMYQTQPASQKQQKLVALAYFQLGLIAGRRGLVQEAEEWYRKSLSIGESLDDRDTVASSYYQLGQVAIRRGELGEAEGWYHKSLNISKASGSRQSIANCYGELGLVAFQQLRLDEAEDWFRKTLYIHEEIGDRHGIALSYHRLGMAAEKRGWLHDAEELYGKSLTVFEGLGDRSSIADSYHQLGIVAEKRGRLDEAEDWYRKAVAIRKELGDTLEAAHSYHQLGNLTKERGRLDEAEDWYRQAIAIYEEADERAEVADSYHQLGTVEQERGRLDDAENWYRKTLATYEEIGNRRGVAQIYGQFGLLAEARGDSRLALNQAIRCVTVFDEFPHPATEPGPKHLALLTGKLGTGALEECWQQVTGKPLPRAVSDYVAAAHSDPEQQQ